MLIEYKFFEPAFYSTDIPDWGTAYAWALKLGEQAQVLVDLGHHAQGVTLDARQEGGCVAEAQHVQPPAEHNEPHDPEHDTVHANRVGDRVKLDGDLSLDTGIPLLKDLLR